MNIERELRDALLSMSAVTTIVGTRVWCEWFRTDVLPAVVFEIDDETQQNAVSGKGSLILADVNIICRANTRAKSRELAEAVRTNGTSPGTGLAGWYGDLFTAILESRTPAAIPKEEGSTDYWYDMNLGFSLHWNEEK